VPVANFAYVFSAYEDGFVALLLALLMSLANMAQGGLHFSDTPGGPVFHQSDTPGGPVFHQSDTPGGPVFH
jgi:hypothetical protein